MVKTMREALLNTNQGLHLVEPAWRNSTSICALADGERHLGHVLKIGGRWHAFDATHFNDESNGFRLLGSFASLSAAKEAVNQSRHVHLAAFAAAC
jgi:hypothetical protein